MHSGVIKSPQPLPQPEGWPLPADDEERRCKRDDDRVFDDGLPAFPVEPPVRWPRVFPGL